MQRELEYDPTYWLCTAPPETVYSTIRELVSFWSSLGQRGTAWTSVPAQELRRRVRGNELPTPLPDDIAAFLMDMAVSDAA